MAGPVISIVVPSLNDARHLGRTLQSLVHQGYPSLEVIIQDGGSADGSVDIAEDFLGRFPNSFRLFVEGDSGPANALNRGFARANGEILGFLKVGDVLLPGCLHSLSREIDPGRIRIVVMGRCAFLFDDVGVTGVEHPAFYRGHFEFLAPWKHGLFLFAQPSVFWHREAWESCGTFNDRLRHAFDYDLFCRFSRRYPFHAVDMLWGALRVKGASALPSLTEAELLDLHIEVSRTHWGSWLSPLRWRLEASHWLYCQHLHEHARHHARRAEEAVRGGHPLSAGGEFLQTLLYSPSMARDRLFGSWVANKSFRSGP